MTTHSLQAWKDKIVDRYHAERRRGEHDDECEFIEDGFFLCHCSKRQRLKRGHGKPPGPLWHSNPTCPRCHGEVEHTGDVWECETCHVSWDPNNYDDPGEFTDEYGDNLAEDREKFLAAHPQAREVVA